MTTSKSLSPATIDTYIAAYPAPVQTLLQQMRAAIQAAAPTAKEKIAYGIPTFYTEQGNLVHFGGFKQHIGFYPGADGISAFKKEWARYAGAKGSVQFPIDEPLPLPLVKRVVEFRLKQQKEKTKK